MNELGTMTFGITFISLLSSNRFGFTMYVSCEVGIEPLNITHMKLRASKSYLNLWVEEATIRVLILRHKPRLAGATVTISTQIFLLYLMR
jgi:hypothetical protein